MATREEAIFCRIAVKNNLLTPDQCRECERLRKESGGGKGIVDVILEKGYLSAKMVAAVLKAQAGVSREETKTITHTREVTDTQFARDLMEPGEQPAVSEQDATIHGELVNEDDASDLPRQPQPGDEAYEKIKREITNLPLIPHSKKTGDNIVYNINIRDFHAEGKDERKNGIVPYQGDLTLQRDEISEDKLLALIKGERVALPARSGVEPASATATAQQSILSALRNNLVLALIGIGMIFAMFVVGIIITANNRPPVVPGGQDGGAGPQTTADTDKGIADMGIEELGEELERGTTSIKKRAARQIAERVIKNGETTGIEYLVNAMRDENRDVREIAAFSLSRFKAEGIRDNTFSMLLGVFDKYEDASFKVRCLNVAAKLEMPEGDLLSLLEKGLEDDSASVRLKALDVLSDYKSKASVKAMASLAGDSDLSVRRQLLRVLSKYDSEYAIRAIVPLVNDADVAIAAGAVAALWQKREKAQGDLILEILTDSKTSPSGLSHIINHVTNLKVSAYLPQYVRLFNHSDESVKLGALNALAALGAEADEVLAGEFAEYLKRFRAECAAPEGMSRRAVVVDALGRIHGINAGNLLLDFHKTDPDPNIREKARQLIVGECPQPVKQALAEYEAVTLEEAIQRKLVLVEAALKKIEENDFEGACKDMDAIMGDTSEAMSKALERSEFAGQTGVAMRYSEIRENAGYARYGDAWVKKDKLWAQIQKDVNDLLDQMKYMDAVQKYRGLPAELKEISGIEGEIEKAIDDVKSLAANNARKELEKVETFIEEHHFVEADKLISTLEMRFPKSEFSIPARRISEVRRGYVKAEKKWRSKIFYIKRSDRNEDVTGRYPNIIFSDRGYLTNGSNVKFKYMRSDDSLQVLLNADKKSQAGMINYSFMLSVNPSRKCDDFSGIEFDIKGPRNTSVDISVQCGAIRYRKTCTASGRMQIAFDDFVRESGIGQELQTINRVNIQIQFDRDPQEKRTYSVYIRGIRLIE